MRRGLVLLFALVCSTFGATEIRYTVTVDPEASLLRVRMELPDTEKGAKLRIPNWAPGSYRLVDNFNLVKNLRAADAQGKELAIKTEDTKLTKAYGDGADRKTVENTVRTWTVDPAPTTIITYELSTVVNFDAVHWSGPSTYLYEVDRINEACRLEIAAPEHWRGAYCGLVETGPGTKEFVAPDYDVLADNPVSVGALSVITYTERGAKHEIVMRGQPYREIDRDALLEACRFVTRSQIDFFGNMPYKKYVWHFNVTDNLDGAGGLEHLSSTQITLASGLGIRAVSVIAHEFYHLWNVKRIRSKALGPFDYTKLPETGALWWLEGVTDYYAHYLLHVYGWVDRDQLYKDVVDNLNTVRRNPARLEISPYDASFRVGEASNGRGNSGGYRVNYYSMGWICGLVLDLEVRARTAGKHSLDDVTKALWEICDDDGPGFEEDEIRRQLIKFGGNGMAEVYDNLIMKPGEVPVEAALAKAGLKLEEVEVTTPNLGATFVSDPTRGTNVTRATGALQNVDKILKIGTEAVEGSRMKQQAAIQRAMKDLKVGDKVIVQVVRGTGNPMDIEVTVTGTTAKVLKVVALPDATPEQKRIGEGWLARRAIR
ncbi:MAG: M61 family metallopeptidase [Methanoregulaceae archaeon]|nr:M61 family metallopeptidase [Methanoregulaceae archaeon]